MDETHIEIKLMKDLTFLLKVIDTKNKELKKQKKIIKEQSELIEEQNHKIKALECSNTFLT